MAHPDSEKPVVLVDADGVLGDFDTAVANRLDELHSDIVHPTNRAHHNILYAYPEEYRQVIRDIIYSDDFFSRIPLYDDALVGWNRLLELGYQPIVCTSPIPDHQRSIEAKKEWIQDKLVPHFGSRTLAMAQITLDKHLIPGMALIDDRPSIPGADLASWKHIVYDQPYNRTIDTVLRLNGWRDDSLEELLSRIKNEEAA